MEILIGIAANIFIGLLFLVLFVWRRLPRAPALTDPSEALRLYQEHFPKAGDALTLSTDGETALLSVSHGVGLLQRHGRRWNARELHAGDLKSVAEEGEELVLKLRDFGWPVCRVRLADPAARARWMSSLRPLAGSAAAPQSMVRHHV